MKSTVIAIDENYKHVPIEITYSWLVWPVVVYHQLYDLIFEQKTSQWKEFTRRLVVVLIGLPVWLFRFLIMFYWLLVSCFVQDNLSKNQLDDFISGLRGPDSWD
jgi:hypothetical protein